MVSLVAGSCPYRSLSAVSGSLIQIATAHTWLVMAQDVTDATSTFSYFALFIDISF